MKEIEVHEASHAVAATILAVPWTHAEVRSDGTGFLRFDGHPADWGDPVLHRRAAIVSLAGAWGESFHAQRPIPWPRLDRAMADGYLRVGAESFNQISDCARLLVSRYWPEIRRVAEHLSRRGSITPVEARACMQALTS